MVWVTGRWLRVALQGVSSMERGDPALPLPGGWHVPAASERQAVTQQGIRKSPWEGNRPRQINTDEALGGGLVLSNRL